MKTLKTTSESSEKARAFTLVELMVAITIICILAALIFPAFASAKAKSNRIKCVNNLRQIALAFRNFADNNNNRLPWQLTPGGLRYYFGGEDEKSTKTIFSLRAMKRQIGGAKLLASPCDGQVVAANEVAQEDWKTYDTKLGRMIPCEAISYPLIEGADVARPVTMLVATRNLSTADLATATWNGANQKSPPENVLSGLIAGQGQAVFADGSARQANDSDIGPEGEVVMAHRSSTGGVSIGPASTAVIGCCGGEKEPWIHVVGVYDRRKNQIRCYLGGKKRGTKYCTITNPHLNPTFIGVWMIQSPQHRGSRLCVPFKGKIDDVSFFNRALTDDEVTGLFESGSNPGSKLPTRGLRATYPFNGNANDESGNGKNGSLRGPKLTKDRFGQKNAALYFDGDDYVKISRPIITNNSDSYTVSAWVLPDEGFSTGMVVSDRPGSGGPSEGYKYYLYFGMDSKPSIAFGVHNASPWRFTYVSGN